MKKKYNKVYSISLEPGYRNYTVRDLIELKGKKKLNPQNLNVYIIIGFTHPLPCILIEPDISESGS